MEEFSPPFDLAEIKEAIKVELEVVREKIKEYDEELRKGEEVRKKNQESENLDSGVAEKQGNDFQEERNSLTSEFDPMK